MRWINSLLCIVMVVFAAAQYNDPDGVLWVLIYGIPAAWAGIAAFRPSLLRAGRLVLPALGLCLAAALAGTIYLWPSDIATWWDSEEVREGLGVFVITLVLAIVGITVLRERRDSAAQSGI